MKNQKSIFGLGVGRSPTRQQFPLPLKEMLTHIIVSSLEELET